MATFSVRFQTKAFADSKKAGLVVAMKKAALQGEAIAKVTLSTPGAGRVYTSRAGGKVKHRASLPGQPPAPDIGDLRKKVTHEVVVQGDEVIARVISPQRYTLPLELGTERIAPRPFLRPTLQRMRAAALAFLEGL